MSVFVATGGETPPLQGCAKTRLNRYEIGIAVWNQRFALYVIRVAVWYQPQAVFNPLERCIWKKRSSDCKSVKFAAVSEVFALAKVKFAAVK